MNVSIMVVILTQTVSILLVASNALVRLDSAEMECFASISMNANCPTLADLKDQDVSIQPGHSDVFVAKDSKVCSVSAYHIKKVMFNNFNSSRIRK